MLEKVVKMLVSKKEKTDVIKANLDSQSKLKTSTSTGRRVTMATSRFAKNLLNDTSVDADTTGNKVNKDNESGYFSLVINSLLKPLNCISSMVLSGSALVLLDIASILYVLLYPLKLLHSL